MAEEPMPVRHRNVQRGTVRAAVFGVSDGLTTNVSLVLGVAGARPDASLVRLAGLAGLLAGAFSMAAGEYVSMRTQAELFQHELDREAREIRTRPDYERDELASTYERRGLSRSLAERVAAGLMRDPTQALEAHAREELGVGTDQLGSPTGAAGSSFASFGIGALVPLLPWFFIGGTTAILASIFAGAAAPSPSASPSDTPPDDHRGGRHSAKLASPLSRPASPSWSAESSESTPRDPRC